VVPVNRKFIGVLIDDVNNQEADGFTRAQRRHKLNESTLYLLAILLAGSVFTFVRGTLFNIAGERVVARIRNQLFEKIMRQDIAFFDGSKTGKGSQTGSDGRFEGDLTGARGLVAWTGELMNRLASDTTGKGPRPDLVGG
jgi:ABC-type multidrug transport system fused ATPase/permease subunit